jgi:hypothetical protein
MRHATRSYTLKFWTNYDENRHWEHITVRAFDFKDARDVAQAKLGPLWVFDDLVMTIEDW